MIAGRDGQDGDWAMHDVAATATKAATEVNAHEGDGWEATGT